MAWELCSKEDITNIHPVPEAELKDDWSTMVEALIRQYMGQPYLGKVQAVTDEYHNGDGTHILRVKKPPIISVEELIINEVPITAGDYLLFDSYVALKSQVFPQGVLNVKISYTSGSILVDDVVRLAAAAMIVAIVNYRKRYGADASLKWGAADQKAGEESPNLNVGLTSHLTTIMRRILRRPNVRVR